MTEFQLRNAYQQAGGRRMIRSKEELCHILHNLINYQDQTDYRSLDWKLHMAWEQDMDKILLRGNADQLQRFLNRLPNVPFKQALIMSALTHIFQRDPGNRNTIFTRLLPTENDLALVQTLISNATDINNSAPIMTITDASLAKFLFRDMNNASHDRDYVYLEMLLEAGLDPGIALSVFLSSHKNYDDIIELLIYYMAGDVESNRAVLSRLLFYIVEENKVDLLREMIRQGLYVQVNSILRYAIQNRASPDLIHLLIDAGVNQDDFQETIDQFQESDDPWVQDVLSVFDAYASGKRKLL